MTKIKRRNNFFILLSCMAGMLLAAGCSKEESPKPQTPAIKHASPNKAVQPIQEQLSSVTVQQSSESTLDFSAKKDPFKPYIVISSKQGKSLPDVPRGDLLPIQNYEVTKFKVAGIIVGLKENRALVIDPSGKGYVVKAGMLIGDHDGVITNISATTIDVLEKYKDESGHVIRNTIKLTLPQKK